MRNLIIFIILLSIAGCGSVEFKTLALYDTFETPPAKEKLEQIIYTDAAGTMWNSLFECGDFEITRETAYSGNSSIKLNWNKAGCEWIGFGNSFSNWTGSDLSKDRFTQALSFYARTQEKVAGAIPIVACLEDFSGGGSYHFIDAGKYLYGLELDTTWKQIIVPLWHFPILEEEVDISSIKQMQFQLEGSGSFYLDDLRIIDYSEEEYQKMRAEVELMKPKGEFNQVVYREGKFDFDTWGSLNNRCQTLEEINEKNGNTCIRWEFDSSDCAWAKWGINWNNWYAVNLRGVINESSIKMKIKVIDDAKFSITLQDFKYNKTEILNEKAVAKKNEWVEITIPLADLKLEEKKFALDQIRQLEFEGRSSGKVFVDDIEIVEN